MVSTKKSAKLIFVIIGALNKAPRTKIPAMKFSKGELVKFYYFVLKFNKCR